MTTLALPPAPVREPAAAVRRRPPLLATSLLLLAVLSLGFAAHVLVVGAVVHAREQELGYAELRRALAEAVAPVGPTVDGAPLAPGTPVALLQVRALGIREVVREGTASGVLTSGPGHRRDSVLPGQAGTSVLFGRQASFGGPFRRVAQAEVGTRVLVTTGQGRAEYRVVAVRRSGDPVPPPPASGARLTLVTADGPAFLPTGVVRVDADLVGTPQPAAAPAAGPLPDAERAMAGDRSGLVSLLLLAQLLLLSACAVAWASARWGARQAWVAGTPVLVLVGLATAHSASALLPNLL